MNNINAVFCKRCKNVIFSRSVHDFRKCSCESISVDGGFEYFAIGSEYKSDFISLKLNPEVLLKQILYADWNYGNQNAEVFPLGYHGKFVIHDNSNLDFYKKLIINFEDIEEYL